MFGVQKKYTKWGSFAGGVHLGCKLIKHKPFIHFETKVCGAENPFHNHVDQGLFRKSFSITHTKDFRDAVYSQPETRLQ